MGSLGLLLVGVCAPACNDIGIDCTAGGSGHVLFRTDNTTGEPSVRGQHAVMVALDDREFHFLCTAEPDAGVSCPPQFDFVEGEPFASAMIDPHIVTLSFTYPDLANPPKKIHAVVFAGAEPTGRTIGQTVFEPSFSHDETLAGEECEIAEGPHDEYPLTP
ncbi:MAG: hypothetical protein U0414_15020 [Polyangiaceae bacterium]